MKSGSDSGLCEPDQAGRSYVIPKTGCPATRLLHAEKLLSPAAVSLGLNDEEESSRPQESLILLTRDSL